MARVTDTGDQLSRYLMIALGGALGSVLRYQVTIAVQSRIPATFPYGTFVVNLSACLIMGFVMTLLSERVAVDPNWRFLIPIGFIGGYSTFSTFEYETFTAVAAGSGSVAAANIVGSVAAGYVALWLGVLLARQLL